MALFKLRGSLSPTQRLVLGILGFVFIFLMWGLLTAGANPLINTSILPRPLDVLSSYRELLVKDELFKNICRSLGFNLAGYIKAILIAIPIGFLIGLIPLFRGSFQRPIDAIRYLPLPAVIGLFMFAFDIGAPLIVNFLAFGILIYLIPVVVQRIDEVDDVYLKTVYTLGASDWSTIRTVYFPSVVSRLSDDIRVLTAISWTYIVIAEIIGNEGGIGALIWRVGERYGRYDKVYGLLIVIIIIGVLQDRVFTYLDREFFPHKYQTRQKYGPKATPFFATMKVIGSFAFNILVWIFLALYVIFTVNEFTGFLMVGDEGILSYLFGSTVWVIHLISLCILGYKVRKLVRGNRL